MARSRKSPGNYLAEDLARLVQAVASAGRASLPGSSNELLSSIVEAAARIFGAAAASILLVNEAEGVLVFRVAYGASDRDLVGTRIPLNQGIAGFVAMSGQPIAISDVAHDPRFNRDFAKSTGYVPRSILAAPLLAGDRVIGVMEILDKINAPSFGMQDIELLGLFAHQAALAIDQAQIFEQLDKALIQNLKQLASADTGSPSDRLIEALEEKPAPGVQRDLIRLSALLNDFSQMGESERETTLKILNAFAEYGRSQRRLQTGAGWR